MPEEPSPEDFEDAMFRKGWEAGEKAGFTAGWQEAHAMLFGSAPSEARHNYPTGAGGMDDAYPPSYGDRPRKAG